MKAVKVIAGIVIALVVVIAIAVFIAVKNLDSIVEKVIEDVGSDVTRVPVDVGSVKITLSDARGELYGLTVKNPPGYTTENAIQFGQINLQIEPQSLHQDVVVIKELTIDGTKLTAEHKGLADINLQQIYNNISTAGGETRKQPAPSTARPSLRFMLEKVSFTNISMDVQSAQFGEKQLSMEDIHMTNLGDRRTGLTAEELANALLTPIVDKARRQANNALRNEAREKLNESLEENISDRDKQKLDKLKSWLDK